MQLLLLLIGIVVACFVRVSTMTQVMFFPVVDDLVRISKPSHSQSGSSRCQMTRDAEMSSV